MINRDLLFYDTFDQFNRLKLSANAANTKFTVGMQGAVYDGAPLIAWQTAVFIGDTRQIWIRGKLWSCQNGQEIEIDKIRYVGGRFLLSPAAITCSEVQYLDANGNILPNYGSMNEADQQPASFKCFFRQRDEWGRERKNEFTQGDFALCQTLTPTRGGAAAKPSYYWRLVINRGDDWIQLSNKPGEYDPNSTWPAADDDIVMFGSRSIMRQSALMLSSYGDGSPSITKYAGINAMNLTEGIPFDGFASRYIVTLDGFDAATGRAFYKSFGDFYFGNPESTTYVRYSQDAGVEIMASKIGLHTQYNQNIDLQQQLENMGVDIDRVQMQADRQFTVWYYDKDTTMDGLVLEWEREGTILEHDQDIFYDVDGETGLAWRFVVTDDFGQEFEWRQIDDQDTLRALEIAKSKKRVFLAEPIPPYDEGDLWVKQVSYKDPNGNAQTKKDMMTCTTAKKRGESFSESDWSPASVTHADLELLGDKFRLYVTDNDRKLVEIEGKITDEESSLHAIVKNGKEEIDRQIETAAGFASSASDSAASASQSATLTTEKYQQVKDEADRAKEEADRAASIQTNVAGMETSVTETYSLSLQYSATLNGYKEAAEEAEKGAKEAAAKAYENGENAGKAYADYWISSGGAAAAILTYTNTETNETFMDLVADNINLTGKVSFNDLKDVKNGDFYIDGGTLYAGYSGFHNSYCTQLTRQGLVCSSDYRGAFSKTEVSDDGINNTNYSGHESNFNCEELIFKEDDQVRTRISADGAKFPSLELSGYDVQIVSSLPSDAASHTTTIYIVKP